MASGVAAVWVPVEDMKRAVSFYRDTMGFEVEEISAEWTEVDANGVLIGLNGRERVGGRGGAVISFQPDQSIDEEYTRLKVAGVEFEGEISSHDWGKIAPFRDTEGNDLQLYAPPA